MSSATDFTVDDEYFNVINSCISLVKQTDCIDGDKIFLLGHSLGIGATVTVIAQNSGFTTVMVVGLVNADVISLFQATAMIMGANAAQRLRLGSLR